MQHRTPRPPIARCAHATTLLATLLMLAASPVGAEDEGLNWKYSLGFDYSNGDYGIEEDDTQIVFLPFSIEASGDRARFKLSIPFLNVDGPSAIAIDGNGNESVESEALAGFGQMSARFGWFFDPVHELAPWIELAGKISAPTESDSALGSRVWSFSLQFDALHRVGDFSPFASFGRKFYAERLDDRFYTSVGSSFRINRSFSLGASYDWTQASVDGAEDGQDIVAFASVRLDPVWSLSPYGIAGLSDGSPEYGIGMTISFRPGNR